MWFFFLRRLKLVSLARLEEAFAGLVLSQLFSTDEFLFEADSETADFALVSYRQARSSTLTRATTPLFVAAPTLRGRWVAVAAPAAAPATAAAAGAADFSTTVRLV